MVAVSEIARERRTENPNGLITPKEGQWVKGWPRRCVYCHQTIAIVDGRIVNSDFRENPKTLKLLPAAHEPCRQNPTGIGHELLSVPTLTRIKKS